MRNIYLDSQLHISSNNLKSGYMTLIGSTGKRYRNLAIHVPGYGWVPCSMALQRNFTLDPKNLVLVVSDVNDLSAPWTSDIWITRTSFEEIRVI